MENDEFEALTTEEAFRKKVFQSFDLIRGEFAEMKQHLANQDLAISQNTALTIKVSEETKGIRDFMVTSADAAKLLCRLAAGWRFTWKWVILSVCGPMAFLYSFFYYSVHGSFPPWFTAVASLFVK